MEEKTEMEIILVIYLSKNFYENLIANMTISIGQLKTKMPKFQQVGLTTCILQGRTQNDHNEKLINASSMVFMNFVIRGPLKLEVPNYISNILEHQ